MMRSITLTLRSLAARFGAQRAGNVAMIYALALLPSLAAVGAAVDLTRAMVVKMRLGEALDAAGLAVGGSIGLSEAEMTEKAQKFFYANYPDDELGTVTALDVTAGENNQVAVSGSARIDTAFMGLFGIFYLDVSVNAQVTRESRGLEVALALDNTGSMAANGKLQSLKDATNELIGILFGDQNTPEHLKMSLVPFSQTVKVDTTQFLNSNWMDTNGQNSTARLNFNNNMYAFAVWATMNNKSWGGCLEARPNGLEETDDAPSAGTPDTLFVPYFEPDGPNNPPYSNYTTYVNDGVSGGQDTRLKNAAKYNGQNKTNPNSDCNMQKILPLTNNKLTLQSYVSGMISTGYTHVGLGASWGWRTLSPTAPYTEGAAYDDEEWVKVLVLMTDGLNTIDNNSTWHKSNYTAYNYLQRGLLGTTNAAAAEAEQDERTLLTCERIKQSGVRIFSILLEENSQGAIDLMQGCASTVDGELWYRFSPGGDELKQAFQEMGQAFSNLRLSQ